eukprot:scaffold15973_cov120-Cylindrotheca_fusiformis.AAC.1
MPSNKLQHHHHPHVSPAKKKETSISQRRKDLFGDCALIEIIHLHDCLRGALNALEKEVAELSHTVLEGEKRQSILNSLERRVAGRFKVIWSVFQAHSSAEDDFIWPALKSKTNGLVEHKPSSPPGESTKLRIPADPEVVEQVQYEEDHADEERMFSMMDDLLTKLRHSLLRQTLGLSSVAPRRNLKAEDGESVDFIMKKVHKLITKLSHHLMVHLDKEEMQCLPLVVKYLSKSEIHDLVGQIMGQRSSETIAQIMTMAVQNLDEAERDEMVTYMKQAMAGTFFDRWLSMAGWMDDRKERTKSSKNDGSTKKRGSLAPEKKMDEQKKPKTEARSSKLESPVPSPETVPPQAMASINGITSQAELEKLIRVIVTNPNLSPQQKNTTIQGLRDSVWKSNQRLKSKSEGDSSKGPISTDFPKVSVTNSATVSESCIPARRVTPPSIYYKKDQDGKIEVAWNSAANNSRYPDDGNVPLFSASELAPTYNDGATGSVLGCPHYARACKLRHPLSGRLYTCRLCCEQEREMPSKHQDEPLDRYAVTEVMCMKCNALQPAEEN